MRGTFVLLCCMISLAALSAAGPKQGAMAAKPVISESEYIQRRTALCGMLDSSSAALFRAADPKWRNGDVNYPYRQESSYFYLTGEKTPSGVLALVPGGITLGNMHGRVVHVSGQSTKDSLAGDEIFTANSRLKEVLDALASKVGTIYVSSPDLRFINDWLNGKPMFVDRDARREFEKAHPGVKLKNASGLMGRLREVKSAAELDLMRRAIAVTGDGIERALKSCRPGGFEYELQAAVESGMRAGGAEGVSFPSIIGSGPNSLILHYDDNERQMQKGEVVVMDVGAEYGGYAADVTRTIPVSGSFTPEQRKVYNVVRSAHDEVIKLAKPGVPTRVLEAKAKEVITDAGYGKYILHGVSHQVGLDVHDAGASDTLRAGMVITVEPGIYIPVEDTSLSKPFRGVGIRLEDDVLVTATGSEVLSVSIPIDPAVIEKRMN
jgi:Xaa-Pro aminopeptidase